MPDPAGTASIRNWVDALDRITNRLNGLGQTKYTYAVLGNGQRTFSEDGPWAGDATVEKVTGIQSDILYLPGTASIRNWFDALGRVTRIATCEKLPPTVNAGLGHRACIPHKTALL